MCKNALLQCRVRQPTDHCNLKHGHELTAFDAQDSATQELFRFGVNYGLHEASSLTHFNCPGDATHRQSGYANVQTLIPSFRFSDPNSTELGVDEDCIRN